MIKPPFYPTPPPKGSSRLERLLFLRSNYIYSMALLLPLLVVGLIYSPTIVVICVGCWLIQLMGLLVLSLQIRAERRAASP